jgi:ribose/xylose/arabinose/galactoside ABC-type transport system permease subunit
MLPMNVSTSSSADVLTADSTPRRAKPNAIITLLRGLLLSEYFVLYLTITMFVGAALIFPRIGLASTLGLPTNISNQFLNMWPLLAVAIGQTFVLIIGGIDLSQGSIMAITSVVGAIFMATTLDAPTYDRSPLWGTILTPEGGIMRGHELAVPIGVTAMLLLGMAIGFLNGFIITRFKIAPFMMTLVSMIFFQRVRALADAVAQYLKPA